MRVLTLNANGIRSATSKGLPALLASLAPDAVCFQEVRALEGAVPLPDGFAECYWHAAERKGYSGVATLLPRPAGACRVGIGLAEFDIEGRVLVTELDETYAGDLGRIELINVYAPSGTTGDERQAVKMRFLAHLVDFVSERLKAAEEQGFEVLLCGDMNIAHSKLDIKNWSSNQKSSGFLPEERAWFSDFLGLGLVDVVRTLAGPELAIYSWWSQRAGARERDVGWRIDYQLASPRLAERATAFGIPRLPIVSDHAPVWVEYCLRRDATARGALPPQLG
ncbi:MAG: exodeoxyribonuclease III [Trueperaceae bacterium]|nr:exodeoxyribonuclease III [Trueperaceae bacterium]